MEIKRIVLTVTTDLNFDQRMIRIASTLADTGYDVLLVGRQRPTSLPLKDRNYRQKRLPCFFQKGIAFYAEYNLRLFFYLLWIRMDVICAIDLDTILPCYFISLLRRKKRVYDAHELFCEMDEIVTRPRVYKVWKAIEKMCVPQFPIGYTIGEFYAQEFQKEYGVQYQVVRNATVLQPITTTTPAEKYILYQGAVNEGRSFETLIPAMQEIDANLIVCGEGNFFEQAKALAAECQVTSKIQFKGYIEPAFLKKYTQEAYVGITLFTDRGKSNYLSLANRFFDYMHAGVPQLCMKYPEYEKINSEYEVAILLDEPSVEEIVKALHTLYTDTALYTRLHENCLKARTVYCWQEQEKTLRTLYSTLLD